MHTSQYQPQLSQYAILQTLCAVVQHHLQLIKQLQQHMWASMGSPGQASAASVLLGLQQRYTRTAEAMLTCAAPISIVGMFTTLQSVSLLQSVRCSTDSHRHGSHDLRMAIWPCTARELDREHL